MEEALFFDTTLLREFADLANNSRLPDEIIILCFRRMLKEYGLAAKMLAEVSVVFTERCLKLTKGNAVDFTLIAAPGFAKNKDEADIQEMRSSQKGNEWHFDLMAHIGMDAGSGLAPTKRCTSGNFDGVTQAHRMFHGQEKVVWAEASCQVVQKNLGADPNITWHIAMSQGTRKVPQARRSIGRFSQSSRRIQCGHSHQGGSSLSGDQTTFRILETPAIGA